MALVVSGNQVKLNSGKVVQAENLGWYDGRQFSNGSFSEPGQIHPQSPQVGAGQLVSKEVNLQSDVAQGNKPGDIEAYLASQRKQAGIAPQPTYPQVQPQTAVSGSSGVTTGAGVGFQSPDAFDPTKFYESAYAGSGIRDVEASLTAKTNQYNEQVAKIKDNPYLSEATMTGRISKLDQKFRADTANIKNDIAMKKADVETQLNLQLKKIDLQSQATKQAWDHFNSLLSSGALNNATGEDIANITRSTGLPSSMIQSAIGTSKAKNAAKNVDPYVIKSEDDSGNVTATVIDQKTGEIIKQTSLGKVGTVTKQAPAKGQSVTEIKAEEKQANTENLIASIKNYNNLSALVGAFGGVLSIDEIYRLYNIYSPFGPADEDIKDVKQGKFNV